MSEFKFLGLALVGLAAGIACSSSSGNDRQFGDGTGGAAQGGTGGGTTATGGSAGAGGGTNTGGSNTGGTGAIVGVMDSGTGGFDPDAPCNAIAARAEARFTPADIIFGVDTSGSMLEEAGFVQANMNVFSQQIIASGIDVHVVMIATAQIFPLFPGICVPAPLGSGTCPVDTNLPQYWHHQTAEVASTDGLDVFMSTFVDWRFALRPDASHTVVIVTDDDARGWQGTADSFITDFTALDPLLDDGTGNPNWKMSGIYSFTNCPSAAQVGTIWREIIQKTGGVEGDLCTQNFAPVFNDLANAIVQASLPLDCEWGIPPAPPGETFDPRLVNVEFTDGAGATQTIFKVDDANACDSTLGGWYYDNETAPTRVIACTESCDLIRSGDDAGIGANNQVDIAFGCASKPIPR